MILSHIVAVSENEVIGKDNSLLWHFPEDLAYFKKRTTGKVLIMGRKTFDCFKKPLPNRFHIVISKSNTDSANENVKFVNSLSFVISKSNTDSANENVKFVNSLSEAYTVAEKMTLTGRWPEEVMIIGGGQIYAETLKDADFIYITRIPGEYQGDTSYSLKLPTEFKMAFSQFSDAVPGLRYEIWSKEQEE